MAVKSNQSLLSTPLHGLYIPIGLLIVGVAIIDYNYVPHAVAAAAVLGGFKVFRGRELHYSPFPPPWPSFSRTPQLL